MNASLICIGINAQKEIRGIGLREIHQELSCYLGYMVGSNGNHLVSRFLAVLEFLQITLQIAFGLFQINDGGFEDETNEMETTPTTTSRSAHNTLPR